MTLIHRETETTVFEIIYFINMIMKYCYLEELLPQFMVLVFVYNKRIHERTVNVGIICS
jgi:hypothetical protein